MGEPNRPPLRLTHIPAPVTGEQPEDSAMALHSPEAFDPALLAGIADELMPADVTARLLRTIRQEVDTRSYALADPDPADPTRPLKWSRDWALHLAPEPVAPERAGETEFELADTASDPADDDWAGE